MDTRIIETKSIGSRPTAVMSGDVDVTEIGDWLGQVYGEVAGYLESQGNPPVGPPFARYHRLGNERFHVEAGFPVARHVSRSNGVSGSSLPSATVAVVTHIGPYDELEATYEALFSWIASRNATPAGDPWEVYFSESTEPPSTWRTVIYQPYRPT